jgi:peptidoglycan/LPS O-acetylase OafA/YrhL
MSGRSDSLDAVRGTAIALVVGYHYWPRLEHASDIGVDLFFVLSGYLIGGILLDNRQSPGSLSTFYYRRAFRILPLYWLLLATASISAVRPDWWFLTFGQNFEWIASNSFPVGDPLSVTWSLAIEEQFYLLLPALVWFLSSRWLVRALWTFVILAPVSRWAAFHFSASAVFLLLPCRLDTLMGGTLIACFVRGNARSPGRWLLLALVAPGLDAGLHLIDRFHNAPLMSPNALLFSVLLLAVARLPEFRIVLLRPFCWLGTGAYAIYLFHLPILALCGDNKAGAILVTGVAALVSWRCIERPLIGFARSRWAYRLPRAELPQLI